MIEYKIIKAYTKEEFCSAYQAALDDGFIYIDIPYQVLIDKHNRTIYIKTVIKYT